MRAKWIVALGLSALALSACGTAQPAPVVVSAPAPAPTVDGIAQPFPQCVQFGSAAGEGWLIYGWNNAEGKQDVISWAPDVQHFVDITRDSPLGFRAVWYCPPL
ncbi:MAG TPA: hypothetical protein VFM12_03145 [Gemmatimonadales bacterium]|nr:hypothetical protein [Gemmatimonadales bacterium]